MRKRIEVGLSEGFGGFLVEIRVRTAECPILAVSARVGPLDLLEIVTRDPRLHKLSRRRPHRRFDISYDFEFPGHESGDFLSIRFYRNDSYTRLSAASHDNWLTGRLNILSAG
jgi:hypothetical protein